LTTKEQHPWNAMTAAPAKSAEPTATPDWPDADWVSPDTYLQLPECGSWYRSMKPSVDFIVAAMLLFPALPLIALAWAAVRMTSKGPGFYFQTRQGRDSRTYSILKIRSMYHNIELKSGVQWSSGQNDQRIFWLGKILRKTHLDELPQLFNVLRGDMSLVGPRPERPEVISKKNLYNKVPGYSVRSSVHPGVTGLAQVQLPADSDVISVRHKVYYDLYYIVNQSFWLDARIAGATLFKAAGVGPRWLRRLFFLPSREAVVRQFLSLIYPGAENDPRPLLQPVPW
jgi:lipopolysaccharide/colanic/teichoic acid biosynthesis glycosyltransferase